MTIAAARVLEVSEAPTAGAEAYHFLFRAPLPLEVTVAAMRALRLAALRQFRGPAPEWVSGHAPDGRVSTEDHIAWLPVIHGGWLIGAEALFPDGVGVHQRDRLAGLLSQVDQIHLDGRPVEVTALNRGISQSVLRRAATWVSVTPVSCTVHLRRQRTPAQALARMCRDAGLPSAVEGEFLDRPTVLKGLPEHTRRFYLKHARLRFASPITGPVRLGALRFLGGGWFAPEEG